MIRKFSDFQGYIRSISIFSIFLLFFFVASVRILTEGSPVEMSHKEESRIFVGGLSWETGERQLEQVFGRFGKVIEAQVWLVTSSRSFP